MFILAVYADGGEDGLSGLAPAQRQHLDQFVASGWCGTLWLREEAQREREETEKREEKGEERWLPALLGMKCISTTTALDYKHEKGVDLDQLNFSDRHNGLRAKMLSNAAQTIKFSSSIGFTESQRVDSLQSAVWVEAVRQAVQEEKEKKESARVLFCHLKAETEEESAKVAAVAESIIGNDFQAPSLMKILVIGKREDALQERERELERDGLDSSDPWVTLRPRQSYQCLNGQPVAVSSGCSLLVCYHLEGTTRRDEVQSLQREEIEKRGGCGRILADHFMHEIGFRVGAMPKYGA